MKKIRCLRFLFKKKIFCNTLFYGSIFLLLFFSIVVIPLLPRWFVENLFHGHLFSHCCISNLFLLEMLTIPTRDMHKHNCEKWKCDYWFLSILVLYILAVTQRLWCCSLTLLIDLKTDAWVFRIVFSSTLHRSVKMKLSSWGHAGHSQIPDSHNF